jgi:hypothetical protein
LKYDGSGRAASPLPPAHVTPCLPTQVDGAAPITSIGVAGFVLCERATERAVLRVSIPEASVALRRCDVGGPGGEGDLPVTCQPPVGDAETGSTFTLTLRAGGPRG